MNAEQFEQHLSQISTVWTVLFEAQACSDQAARAQQQLLQRYHAAVYRYLLGATRNPDAADELFQEFALRFVRGDFKRAHPERGRFRDFLRTALYHLVVDYYRQQRRTPRPLLTDSPEPAEESSFEAESDKRFLQVWRAELLNRAWAGLAQLERDTGQPLHTLLRYRAEHPDLRSAQMAETFSARLGKPVKAGWIRKQLFLARQRFTVKLIEEVRRSLGDAPSEEELFQELVHLDLLQYCRSALHQGGQA